MQTDYLFYGIRGYKNIDKLSYIFTMKNDKVQYRLKVLRFYTKYGLEATIEAFSISRRTIYRWKSKLKNSSNYNDLAPKSTRPKNYRKSSFNKTIVYEIKRLRELYPNIGKAKLYILLKPYCKNNNLTLPSESSIGRISHKDKMRITPYRVDRLGRAKTKKRTFKDRKPKHLKTKPMQMWVVVTIQKVSNGIRRYIMTIRLKYKISLYSSNTN